MMRGGTTPVLRLTSLLLPLHHKLNQNVMEGEQQVMSAYEQAFRKIKEATGVGDVNEVIQKFVTQKDTERNLMTMTKDAQARIDQLAEERSAIKASVDCVRARLPGTEAAAAGGAASESTRARRRSAS